MYHVRLRGADVSTRVVRGSVSITGALGERRSASLRLRRPEGVTLEVADLDETHHRLSRPSLPRRRARAQPGGLLDAGRTLMPVSVFDGSIVGGYTDPDSEQRHAGGSSTVIS